MRRSAVFLPMPGSLDSEAVSPSSTHRVSDAVSMPDRIARPSFAPTPLTLSSMRNTSRSRTVENP